MKKKSYTKPEIVVANFDNKDSITVNVSSYQLRINTTASGKINKATVIDF